MRTSPPPEFPKIPEFQTDSQFDLGKYQRWLTSSVAQQYLPSLEAQYRDQIKRSKLLSVVTADVYLSDAALWQQYRDDNEKVKVELAAIVPGNVDPRFGRHGVRRRGRGLLQDSPGRLQAAQHRVPELRRRFPASPTRADTAAARGAGRLGARRDRRGHALRRRRPARIGRYRQRRQGRRARRVDSRRHGCGVRFGRVRDAAQQGVAAGAVPVRLPPHRGDQPQGQQGQGPAHPLSDRARRQPSRPARRPGRQPRAPRRRPHRPGRARYGVSARSSFRSATPVRSQKAPRCSSGSWWCRMRASGRSRPRWAPRARSSSRPTAFYVFRLDSLRPAGVPPLSEIRSAVAASRGPTRRPVSARKLAEDYLKRVEAGSTLRRGRRGDEASAQGVRTRSRRVNPPLDDPVGGGHGLRSRLGQGEPAPRHQEGHLRHQGARAHQGGLGRSSSRSSTSSARR